jgi:hypothetical protein
MFCALLCAVRCRVEYDALMTNVRSDEFSIAPLWLRFYGQHYTQGCGRCPQQIDFPSNTVLINCAELVPGTDRCAREPSPTAAAASASASAASSSSSAPDVRP